MKYNKESVAGVLQIFSLQTANPIKILFFNIYMTHRYMEGL